MIKLGLDTESLHLWFQNKRMNIIEFIEKAHELGLDGVMINVIQDYNLNPEWGTLESNDIEHLKKVRQTLEKYHMFAEMAAKGIEYDHLVKLIETAEIIGMDTIRTYIPITLNPKKCRKTGGDGRYDLGKVRLDFDPDVFEEAVVKLKKIVPILQKHRIKLALENHEYETSEELVDVVKKIDSPWVGLHYDFGNSMMAWEEPEKAAVNMAPYTYTTHFKDHIVIPCEDDEYKYVVCGVPAGEGNIDLKRCLKIMMDNSSLDRLMIEMCYPYCAQFKRTPGVGGVSSVGQGCFQVEKPLYDENVLAPKEYYYPQEVSEELLEELLVKQMEGVERSVAYTKQLCAEYTNS